MISVMKLTIDIGAPTQTQLVLRAIIKGAGGIERMFRRGSFTSKLAPGLLEDYDRRSRLHYVKQRTAFNRIKKKGWIQEKENGNFLLTSSGIEAALIDQIVLAPMFNDGTICVVMFDIPESRRKVRNELSAFLKRSSFVAFQRSVYISPFDAFEPLKLWIKLKGYSRWVEVYRATKVVISKSGRSSKL